MPPEFGTPRRERPQTIEDFVREIKESADKLLVDGAQPRRRETLEHRIRS